MNAAVPAPPDPPEGSPLVIKSFAGVALAVAARHHAGPSAWWLLLALLILLVVAFIRLRRH